MFFGCTINKSNKVYVNYEYYENGKIKYEVEMINGKISGTSRYWNKYGSLINKVEYLNGKTHGEWISYYANGEVNYIANYKFNKRHGIMTEYYPNGNIKSESIYDSDKLKIRKSFDIEGKLIEK